MSGLSNCVYTLDTYILQFFTATNVGFAYNNYYVYDLTQNMLFEVEMPRPNVRVNQYTSFVNQVHFCPQMQPCVYLLKLGNYNTNAEYLP